MFPLQIGIYAGAYFICALAGEPLNSPLPLLLGSVAFSGFFTYEICRKLDPTWPLVIFHSSFLPFFLFPLPPFLLCAPTPPPPLLPNFICTLLYCYLHSLKAPTWLCMASGQPSFLLCQLFLWVRSAHFSLAVASCCGLWKDSWLW